MADMPERITVEVDGRRLTLSHLDKPLWPEFTKGEALDYYARVADALLPHTRNRAASFVRFPEGVDGERFSAKNPPGGTPPWVHRVDVPSKTEGSKEHVSVDDRPSLMALANLYCLEIHVPQWNGTDGPELHDRLVVDLDPGEGADLTDCCAVALLIREALGADGLPCFPVTSGSKGLHLYAPLLPSPADAVLGYARLLAERLAIAHPKQVVARMTKSLRRKASRT